MPAFTRLPCSLARFEFASLFIRWPLSIIQISYKFNLLIADSEPTLINIDPARAQKIDMNRAQY